MNRHGLTTLDVAPNSTLYHTGPSFEQGPLPSFFYFSLSGPDSLTLDPYNQPVQFISHQTVRFFSMTLPAHEEGLSPHNALTVWAESMAKGVDLFAQFFETTEKAVQLVIDKGLADPEKLAIGGLSRGAFFACHIAAREKRFRHLLLFAPLTKLEKTSEFREMRDHPDLHAYDLFALAPTLADRNIRFYIGNNDTRVDTKSCFAFAMDLVAHAPKRSSAVELIMSPSIGQHGHGTSPKAFRDGAEWLAEKLQHV